MMNVNSVKANHHQDTQPRHLSLSGIVNLRDVGGYVTLTGGRIRWGRLWRSDSPHRLSVEGQATLISAGLRTVLDLRVPFEVNAFPNVFADNTAIHYRNIPLIPDVRAEERVLSETLGAVYRSILDDCRTSVKAAFDLMSMPDATPILVHCTVGKDRTGMIVALALSAVGVPDETIVTDYALTDQYIGALRAEFASMVPETEQERVRAMLACTPDLMIETLKYLKAQYGGAEQYLRAIGISEAQLAMMRSNLVEI